ncbi:MAG: pyrroloquinoline quinone biosynthesis protein PqqB [Hyphomicrobiales bacterium]|nr:pyrroloquinoline quinone biosynthesis protein PqqB [Hyphomicrobiales bacterium]
MKLKVLGSAAGGGFPQWNCNARLSRLVREGQPGLSPRTQSSLALSADGERWVICNASPDIRQQIAATPELHPRANQTLRNSPIKAVVLTNGDVDHIAGLLSLRERHPFSLYGTHRILHVLDENSVFRVCDPEIVTRTEFEIGEEIELAGPEGPLGVIIEPFAVPGKVPLYMEDLSNLSANFGANEGDTIALKVAARGSNAVAYYIPGCAYLTDALKARVAGADALLFDGTVYHDDEMIREGVGTKTGARMGHIAIAGENGSLAAFADVAVKRKIYIHINTTNPILEPGSEAEQAVRAGGWEIGFDGMEIDL